MTKPGKWFSAFVCLAVLAVAAASFAARRRPRWTGTEAKPAMHAMAKPVVWPADQLKWTDAPGVGREDRRPVGRSREGTARRAPNFQPDSRRPSHSHSADLRQVVVSGTMIHGEADGKETRLGPGSYLFGPHTEQHTTACDAASECVMFVEANGKFDLVMPGAKKMGKKAAK